MLRSQHAGSGSSWLDRTTGHAGGMRLVWNSKHPARVLILCNCQFNWSPASSRCFYVLVLALPWQSVGVGLWHICSVSLPVINSGDQVGPSTQLVERLVETVKVPPCLSLINESSPMNIQIKCQCKKNEGVWKPGHNYVVFLNFLSLGPGERGHGSVMKEGN